MGLANGDKTNRMLSCKLIYKKKASVCTIKFISVIDAHKRHFRKRKKVVFIYSNCAKRSFQCGILDLVKLKFLKSKFLYIKNLSKI